VQGGEDARDAALLGAHGRVVSPAVRKGRCRLFADCLCDCKFRRYATGGGLRVDGRTTRALVRATLETPRGDEEDRSKTPVGYADALRLVCAAPPPWAFFFSRHFQILQLSIAAVFFFAIIISILKSNFYSSLTRSWHGVHSREARGHRAQKGACIARAPTPAAYFR
jgi:hypothetical protein